MMFRDAGSQQRVVVHQEHARFAVVPAAASGSTWTCVAGRRLPGQHTSVPFSAPSRIVSDARFARRAPACSHAEPGGRSRASPAVVGTDMRTHDCTVMPRIVMAGGARSGARVVRALRMPMNLAFDAVAKPRQPRPGYVMGTLPAFPEKSARRLRAVACLRHASWDKSVRPTTALASAAGENSYACLDARGTAAGNVTHLCRAA